MTGDQPISTWRTAGQQHPCPADQTRSGSHGHSMADAVPAQVRTGPCDLGARHRAMTRSSTQCPAGDKGTAAADEASRGKMAQIQSQTRHCPAQRHCRPIRATAGQRPILSSDPMAQDSKRRSLRDKCARDRAGVLAQLLPIGDYVPLVCASMVQVADRSPDSQEAGVGQCHTCRCAGIRGGDG